MSDSSSSPILESTETPESHQNGSPTWQTAAPTMYVNPQYLSGGKKSLSGISIRAYGLGYALGFSTLLASQWAYYGYGLWRAPFFISTLAIFHYLEFDMTARHNPSDATIDSFLLLSNGMAYTIAHSSAMVELLIRYSLASMYSPSWASWNVILPSAFPSIPAYVPVMTGMFLIVLGQFVRSAAMSKAKANFNHIVQFRKKDDHVLVTTGIYAFSRHPSYFGFFWWGLGTQLVLGNRLCFVAYAVVLWRFFSHRIMHEERHLVSFFGQAYLDYRKATPVLIPFIH